MSQHKIMVVVGPHRGDKFIQSLFEGHTLGLFFEPMPEAAKWIRDNNDPQYIVVTEAAVGTEAGRATLNKYNGGLSSSLGVCTKQAVDVFTKADLSGEGSIEVDVINLDEWLQEAGVDRVETLMTDAQGMDLAILKTMSKWLREKRIRKIICECDADWFQHYDGLPSNRESDFHAFMAEFPWYRFSKISARCAANPDVMWELE